MRRYLIIAIAIMAAILVMSLVKMIQARRAKARGEIPHKTSGIDMSHVISPDDCWADEVAAACIY